MTTATLQGLLDAVIREPDCDVVRYAFADALEEDGQTERAEFIRVQIELAKCPHAFDAANHGGSRHDTYLRFTKFDCRWCELEHRESLLLSGPHGHPWSPWCLPFSSRKWRRGFVESVTCSLAKWLEHGPAIVRACPLRTARMPCKQPWHQPIGPNEGTSGGGNWIVF